MLRGLLSTGFAACLMAGAAAAELPEPERHGPACTPVGCSGRNGSAAAHLAGFGLATLAIAGATRASRRSRP